jgi:hypothetical protein
LALPLPLPLPLFPSLPLFSLPLSPSLFFLFIIYPQLALVAALVVFLMRKSYKRTPSIDTEMTGMFIFLIF